MPDTVGTKLRAARVRTLGNTDIFSSLGGCSLSTTSASYVDITGASKSFTKIGGSADSDLIVQASVGCYATVAATTVKLGVNVNGADADLSQMPINAANSHTALPVGAARITGLAAGTYTIKLRMLRVGGTGTVTMDVNDTATMIIQERAK